MLVFNAIGGCISLTTLNADLIESISRSCSMKDFFSILIVYFRLMLGLTNMSCPLRFHLLRT